MTTTGVEVPKPFKVYPVGRLPSGFRYPERLLQFASSGEYPAIYPWWFIDAESPAGTLAFSIRTHDRRNLVPFAKVDDGRDDIACFDGDDATGNPEVLMLILDDSGRKYAFQDFASWLAAAEADATR